MQSFGGALETCCGFILMYAECEINKRLSREKPFLSLCEEVLD